MPVLARVNLYPHECLPTEGVDLFGSEAWGRRKSANHDRVGALVGRYELIASALGEIGRRHLADIGLIVHNQNVPAVLAP
jgi:hypothetical protein